MTLDTVVVTGGAGFVGSHLVDWIVEHSSARVLILDDLSRGRPELVARHLRSGRAVLVEHDVRDLAGLQPLLQGASLVFHLAAQSNVMGAVYDIRRSFDTNVVGTFNVLFAAHEAGVERVVFTSSREVYGEPASLPVAEDQPLWAKNGYGASKVAGEQYCEVFRRNYGLDVRVLRLANVYGPRDRDRVIPLFCERAAQGRPLVVYGGSQVLDFVWVGDVARSLWETAFLPSWEGPTNVGTGTGVTIRDLASRVKRLFGRSDLLVQIERAREVEVSRFVADTGRMRRQFNWAPDRTPLRYLARLGPSYVVEPVDAHIATEPYAAAV